MGWRVGALRDYRDRLRLQSADFFYLRTLVFHLSNHE